MLAARGAVQLPAPADRTGATGFGHYLHNLEVRLIPGLIAQQMSLVKRCDHVGVLADKCGSRQTHHADGSDSVPAAGDVDLNSAHRVASHMSDSFAAISASRPSATCW